MTFDESDASNYDEAGVSVAERLLSEDGAQAHHRGQPRFAYLLAHYYGDRLMHVHGLGWYAWDGARWVEDTGQGQRAVLHLLRMGWDTARTDRDMERDVRACESAAGIAGVLSIASALEAFACAVDDLDADPYLLNVANGTLDLRTFELRPHDPADRLTKITTGAWRSDVDGATWARFLASVLPDEDERGYLQRVVGQALYGRVGEHLFPVLIGTGANGKGTFYGAVEAALGDYVRVIDPALLMASDRTRTPGPELMELMGARLVIGSETEDGRKLDEATMKRLTGGDSITARRLYREPVTWTPTHQLVYVTNHLPTVKGNDPAVWRRVRVIPFDVVVPVGERDPHLPARLQLEADAVLAWAVDGYRAYLDGGMCEPASVTRATDEYQADSDAVGRFIDEACMASPVATATTRELFTAWQRWAVQEGAEALTERALSKELERLGYESKRTKRGKTWAGLAPYRDDEEGL
ncbi:phage/plasmid primase, P4 family [Janibacter sp. YB324]|uniref:DNA primase family protein n=1 Tax=Janibacter sp. YB324 TaxID=2761047 RepID=UPI0016254172|nr:phage/plasmid primase, P4 family [Janibacter sp. YB324]QNF93575.1 hypothetical protein H7A72_12520 [Janibacter sp. YB324]